MSKVHPNNENDLDVNGESTNEWTNSQAQPPPAYGFEMYGDNPQAQPPPVYPEYGGVPYAPGPYGQLPPQYGQPPPQYGQYPQQYGQPPPQNRRQAAPARNRTAATEPTGPQPAANTTQNDEPELNRHRNGHAFDHFWTDNFGPEGPSQSEGYMASCGCSCCLGPCCSDVRQNDWKKVFLTFTFWTAVVELIMLIIEFVFNENSTFYSIVLGLNEETLINLGGKYLPYIYCRGHVFRYITPVVLHSGLLHFLFNMLFTYRVMFPREVYWGILRTAVMYAASGIGGSVLSLVMYQWSVSVGASGALCGIFGGYIVDVGRMWKKMNSGLRYSHGVNIVMYVIIMTVMGFTTDGIDNGAHLGGLLSGVFLGMIILQKNLIVRIVGGVCLSLLWILPTALLYPLYKIDCALYKK